MAEEQPIVRRIWYADSNEELADFDVGVAQRHRATGAFKDDYLAYCQATEIAPHPCILPPPAPKEAPSPSPSRMNGRDSAYSRASQFSSRNLTPVPMSTPGGSVGGGEEELEEEGHPYDMTVEPFVNVRHFRLDTATLRLASLALADCMAVSALTLSHCSMTAAQVALLAQALPGTGIRSLIIENNAIDETTDISELMSPPAAATGGGGRPGSAGKQPAAAAEASLPGSPRWVDPSCIWSLLLVDGAPLQRLTLRGNGINSEGAHVLAEKLSAPSSLESVNLFMNRIDDDGGVAIVKALEFATHVQSLSLAGNPVTGRTLAALATMLTDHELDEAGQAAHRSASDRVSVANRAVTASNRAKRWDPALPEIPDLARLRVPADDEAADEATIYSNVTLLDLNLGSTQITDADVAALAEAIGASPTKPPMRLLSVTRCGVRPATQQALVGQLPEGAKVQS